MKKDPTALLFVGLLLGTILSRFFINLGEGTFRWYFEIFSILCVSYILSRFYEDSHK